MTFTNTPSHRPATGEEKHYLPLGVHRLTPPPPGSELGHYNPLFNQPEPASEADSIYDEPQWIDSGSTSYAPLSETDLPAVSSALMKELDRVNSPDLGAHPTGITKEDLAIALDGFARALRGESGETRIRLDDKSQAELAQMKDLLLEAQETIISLLNDRVVDRAKMARLESEVRVMPDMQSQANRAMGLALAAEEMQKELTCVKQEVERLRSSYMRVESTQPTRSWMQWLFGLGKES